MLKEIIEHEPMETRGRAKKANRSRDMLSSLENWVINLEELVGDMKVTLELVMSGMKDLRGDNKGFVDDTLEAFVTAMKEEIADLKGELTIYKAALGNGMMASGPKQHHVDVSKLEKFKGAKSAREVDSFLWELEQYF
ncbi:hypothetical protein PVK06_012460 [Gossypium arboreum]|uniref:Uncharacterized protein n=1 Tax=Gossypium arboreum TaxID=29729 RepID=A0ABR0QCQ8_GOSAR|nr:hypothetical protein PVK06_012460 [Gossypium arboreum]